MIPSITSLPECYKFSGIASRDPSKAEMYAKQFNCQAYSCYESLLKDPAIDAVYIPLPNGLHYRYVMLALEQGKHVLVEKSLGCTFIEVQQMVEKAKDNKLVLLENFQFRFHVQLTSILNFLREGAIGDLRCVRVAFGFPPFQDPNNIRYRSDLGGGALLDAGAYAMKIAPYFLGTDIVVSQGSMAFDEVRDVDIWGGGVLQQSNGPLFCQFSYGFDNHYQCSLELWGSTGKLSTNRIFTAPPDLKPKIFIESKIGLKEIIIQSDDAFRNILKYFHGLINGKEDVGIEYKQNIQQANLISSFKYYATVKQ